MMPSYKIHALRLIDTDAANRLQQDATGSDNDGLIRVLNHGKHFVFCQLSPAHRFAGMLGEPDQTNAQAIASSVPAGRLSISGRKCAGDANRLAGGRKSRNGTNN